MTALCNPVLNVPILQYPSACDPVLYDPVLYDPLLSDPILRVDHPCQRPFPKNAQSQRRMWHNLSAPHRVENELERPGFGRAPPS